MKLFCSLFILCKICDTTKRVNKKGITIRVKEIDVDQHFLPSTWYLFILAVK